MASGSQRSLARATEIGRVATRHGFGYLVERRCIVQLTDINRAYLEIHSHEVLEKIAGGSGDWEAMVPPNVAAAIKERRLFGYG